MQFASELVVDRAAVVALDFTDYIVDGFTFDGASSVDNASRVWAAARDANAVVAHVTPDGQYHAKALPAEGDLEMRKSRIGAFSTTGLDVALRSADKDHLLITGVATSGTVLSTARWAFDLGYKVHIVRDGCSDPDEAVHRLLTEPSEHSESWVGLWRIASILDSETVVKAFQTGSA